MNRSKRSPVPASPECASQQQGAHRHFAAPVATMLRQAVVMLRRASIPEQVRGWRRQSCRFLEICAGHQCQQRQRPEFQDAERRLAAVHAQRACERRWRPISCCHKRSAIRHVEIPRPQGRDVGVWQTVETLADQAMAIESREGPGGYREPRGAAGARALTCKGRHRKLRSDRPGHFRDQPGHQTSRSEADTLHKQPIRAAMDRDALAALHRAQTVFGDGFCAG